MFNVVELTTLVVQCVDTLWIFGHQFLKDDALKGLELYWIVDAGTLAMACLYGCLFVYLYLLHLSFVQKWLNCTSFLALSVHSQKYSSVFDDFEGTFLFKQVYTFLHIGLP